MKALDSLPIKITSLQNLHDSDSLPEQLHLQGWILQDAQTPGQTEVGGTGRGEYPPGGLIENAESLRSQVKNTQQQGPGEPTKKGR